VLGIHYEKWQFLCAFESRNNIAHLELR
jgi:hypothetical protein